MLNEVQAKNRDALPVEVERLIAGQLAWMRQPEPANVGEQVIHAVSGVIAPGSIPD